MANRIAHRGPDGEGYLTDEPHGVYMANRRLAVLDPDAPDQPFWNDSRQIGVVYNGEIYNEPDLRAELQQHGRRYHTDTDTETIPHLFERDGIGAFGKLNGMFAFAIWDARKGEAWLVRDPIGIKPLFVWDGPRGLAFASEIKCFLEIPDFRATLDRRAMHQLLNVRFVPGEQTLFSGVRKLSPGHWLKWSASGGCTTKRYWELPEPEGDMTDTEAADGFYDRFEQAVERQLRSDVPLGVYLSGGIDSSLLVAALARRGVRPTTFCLGFGEPTDELHDARRVAQYFETDHHEETIAPNCLDEYARAVYHLEEPKVNGLQGFQLARAARRRFTVALSGLGGDELLCGYNVHTYLRKIAWLNRVMEGSGLSSVTANAAGKLLDFTGGLGGFRADNLKRIVEWGASAGDPTRLYAVLRNGWDFNERIGRWLYRADVWRDLKNTTRASFDPHMTGSSDLTERTLRCELQVKMVDDFLANSDRMSMAVGLEERVPFLDLDVVEFMARVPARVKFGGGILKRLVKEPRDGWLPASVLDKRKWGFTFDSVQQAKKDLLTVARRELTREAVGRLGVFRYEAVAALLNAKPHRSLRWHFFLLWMILGLHYWHRAFVEGSMPEETECRQQRVNNRSSVPAIC